MIDNEKRIANTPTKKYKEIFGVEKYAFDRMLKILYLADTYVDLLGNRIRPDYLTAEFPLWLELNGFKRLRFHDLRHSCASLLLANGVPLKQIQDWLGHSSFKITADAYAHLDYDSKINAANAMTWIKKTSLGGSEPEAAMFAIEEDDTETILKQKIKDLLGDEIDNRILQSLINEVAESGNLI